MALLKRPLNISLSSGIDTKSDPKQVIEGKLLVLENATLQNTGEITKRNGNVILNSPLAAGNALAAYKDELVAMDGNNLYSYSAEEQTFDLKGSKVACDVSFVPVIRNSQNQTNPDSASIQGLTCYAWQGYDPSNFNVTTGVSFSVFDNVTNQSITTNVLISATAINPKVKALGTNAGNSLFVIFYFDGSAFKYVTVTVANPHTFTSAVSLATGLTAQIYDVAYLNNNLYVGYQNNSNTITAFILSSSLVVSGTTTITQDCSIYLSVNADTVLNQIWFCSLFLVAAANYKVEYTVRSNSLASVLAKTNIEAVGIQNNYSPVRITCYPSNGTAKVLYDVISVPAVSNGVASNRYLKTSTITNAGVVTGPADYLRGLGLFSKIFSYNNNLYTVCIFNSPIQPTFFVIDLNGNFIAKINPAQSADLTNSQYANIASGLLVEVNASSNSFQFPVIQQDQVIPTTSSVLSPNATSINLNYPSFYSQTGIISYTLSFGTALVSEEIANGLQTTGGIVTLYDGATSAELGFSVYPEVAQVNPVPLGGIIPGSYDYAVVYEWVDNYGQVHRSSPSIPATINNTSVTQNISVTLTNASNAVALGGTFAYGAGIYIGMPITSTHIPASTTITNVFGAPGGGTGNIIISNNATASISEPAVVNNTVTTNGTLSLNSNIVSLSPIYKGFYHATPAQNQPLAGSGEYYIYMSNTRGLMPQMTSTTFPETSAGNNNGRIVSIDGNVALFSGVEISGEIVFKNRILGTVTIGSPTMTGIPSTMIPNIRVGMTIDPFTTSFPANTTVLSIGTTTITLSANATSNAVFLDLEMPDSAYNLWDGEGITGTSIPAGTQILDTNDQAQGNVGFNGNTIRLTKNASATVSSPELLTASGVYGTEIAVNTLRETEKTTPVNVVLYRTLNAGTQYFRVSSAIAPTLNDKTQDYIYLYDNLPDNQIEGNEQLYTNGNVVDNIASPATTLITQYQNRLLAVPSESPNSFWYSQQVVPGSPVEFSDALTWNVDSRGGAITALHQMDSNLIIFKQNTIFYMNGSGPSPNGSNNDFTNPLLISTDSGCIDPKSVVIMPLGLMYKSLKGIYILKRDLSVNYVGADVEAYNSFSVTSSLVIDKLNQVRFTLNSGVVLVYDYFVNQWYVFTNIAAVDAVSFQNYFSFMKSDGSIYQEGSNIYTDNGAFIPIKAVTSWLSLAGIQGFERLYKFLVLGDYKSPHTLDVSFAYDFASSANQTTSIPVLSDPGVYQYRVFPSRQKCEAIQVTLQETQSSSFGQGLNISGLALEVGMKTGLNKLPAAKSYG